MRVWAILFILLLILDSTYAHRILPDTTDSNVTQNIAISTADGWDGSNIIGQVVAYFARVLNLLASITLGVGLVLRMSNKKIGGAGLLFFYRFVMFTYAFCFVDFLRFEHLNWTLLENDNFKLQDGWVKEREWALFRPDGATDEQFNRHPFGWGIWRGWLIGFITNFNNIIHDSYFSIGYLYIFPRTPSTAPKETIFGNAVFVELIIYLILLGLSLLTVFLLKKGDQVSHFIHGLRFLFAMSMGLYFLPKALIAMDYDWEIGERMERKSWQYVSYIVGLVMLLFLVLELTLLVMNAIKSLLPPSPEKYHADDRKDSDTEHDANARKLEYAEAGAHPPKRNGENNQTKKPHTKQTVLDLREDLLIWNVLRDFNSSFISRDIPEAEPISRFYNIVWIIRWVLVVTLIAIFHLERRTITFFCAVLHLIMLLYTITVVAKKGFSTPTIGILIVIEEFLIFIWSCLTFALLIDEHSSGAHIGSTVTWIFVITIFICFGASLLIEILIAVLNLVDILSIEEDQKENFNPEGYEAFKFEEEDLDKKVRMYNVQKNLKGMGSVNLNDPKKSDLIMNRLESQENEPVLKPSGLDGL